MNMCKVQLWPENCDHCVGSKEQKEIELLLENFSNKFIFHLLLQ